ncbi:META domain-containing protein [Xanthobacter oligotrophicus]|uniref:META domain-containing protein n=1 Tax=Xanthobacter oligotrophicus TaxID=2607286 RepID=A0ABW6ZSM0_9HYPH
MRPVVVLSAIATSLFLSIGGASQAAQNTADGGDRAAPITLPWTARGNEPGWVLTLDAGQMLYRTADGALRIEAALPKPEFRDGTWVYRAPQADLAVSLQRKICRDTMTGMPSPISASVQAGGKTVTGCGGNPSDLLGGGEWQIIGIGDQAVPEGVKVSLTFDTAAGQVSGASGCNRYFGAFKLSGEGLSFAQGMAGSMMACEEVPAGIERAFLSAMAKVQRFDIGSDGALLLITADGVNLKSKARPEK